MSVKKWRTVELDIKATASNSKWKELFSKYCLSNIRTFLCIFVSLFCFAPTRALYVIMPNFIDADKVLMLML